MLIKFFFVDNNLAELCWEYLQSQWRLLSETIALNNQYGHWDDISSVIVV